MYFQLMSLKSFIPSEWRYETPIKQWTYFFMKRMDNLIIL